ncbi:MAG: hypothetical protein EOP06_26320 [Proteobacteria bacterium]|nr:MAG: hypothetical protein EOP06_26320 [Pseudomonadota bacterium]
MIFAISDYIQYRLRRGRYSKESLEKENFKLATEENFPDFRKYGVGDMLFASTAESFLSWIAMYWANGPISHVANFYENGIVHDCTTDGVLRHSFANYLDGKSYLRVVRLPPTADRAAMREFMDRTLGHGYNWKGVFKLGLLILSGAHPGFSWKLYFDVIAILSLLTYVLILLPITLAAIPISILIVLTFLVIKNRANQARWDNFYDPVAVSTSILKKNDEEQQGSGRE